MVYELKDFKGFSLALGMLSATACSANSVQICPKLPKFAKPVQKWNFEIPPKIEILVFLKNIISNI
jgi:hypothetical protein